MALHSLKQGIDLPVMQQLAQLPWTSNTYGCSFIEDGKRFIYAFAGNGSTSFYRYDIYTDAWTQLYSCPVAPASSSNNQVSMAYDASRQRIYVVASSTSFYYYDVQAGVWSTTLAALPVAIGPGANLIHTCPEDAAGANDDYLYYFAGDGSSRKLYRYSISGNAWTEMGTDIIPTSAPSNGAYMEWARAFDPDKIYICRGNNSKYIYTYSISGNSIDATPFMLTSNNTLSIGSISVLRRDTNELYWVETNTRQINKSKLALGAVYTNTATGATATSLSCATENWETDIWYGAFVTITGGTGAGQTRRINSNMPNMLMLSTAWTTTPDATSTFEIKWSTHDYGAVTSSTSTVITDSSRNWVTNQWQYFMVKIVAGTGAGQSRMISSSTANTLTVSPAFTTAPDATSKYEVLGFRTMPEGQIPYSTSSNSYTGQCMCFVPIKGLPFVFYSRKNAQGDFFRFMTTSP